MSLIYSWSCSLPTVAVWSCCAQCSCSDGSPQPHPSPPQRDAPLLRPLEALADTQSAGNVSTKSSNRLRNQNTARLVACRSRSENPTHHANLLQMLLNRWYLDRNMIFVDKCCLVEPLMDLPGNTAIYWSNHDLEKEEFLPIKECAIKHAHHVLITLCCQYKLYFFFTNEN